MPWQLEIHHIDVQSTGDATLIIAREIPPYAGGAPNPVIRSVLVDGGHQTQWVDMHNYVGQQLGLYPVGGAVVQLTAIIMTHYQADHTGGIIRILKRLTTRYANVAFYDQGWPAGGLSPLYTRYCRAITGRGDDPAQIAAAFRAGRTRPTNVVQADGAVPNLDHGANVQPAAPAGYPGTVVQPANWLLTGAAPADPLWAGFVGGAPVGAPTMQFIAANRYVRTALGNNGPWAGFGQDADNEKSVGVVVTFNNFRYYVAGDIETNQEAQIQTFLNAANNAGGRVLAIKTSHHGSNSATSRAFVSRLRPDAAFISCGTGNQHTHPATETINVLDGYAAAANLHGAGTPPNTPVSHYLTGYQRPNNTGVAPMPPPQGREGEDGSVAGDPQPPGQPGHIVLTVTAAQSNNNVLGAVYLEVQAAANAAATTVGVPGVMLAGAMAAATAAAEGALSAGASLAASRFLVTAGLPGAALAAAAAAGAAIAAGNNGAAVATAVTLAAMAPGAGAGGGPAAGAGAAAGVVVGGVGGPSMQAAVAAAVAAAGLGAVPAAAAGVAAAGLAAPALGLFNVQYWDIALGGAQNIPHV